MDVCCCTKTIRYKKIPCGADESAFATLDGQGVDMVLPVLELTIIGLLLFSHTRLMGMYLSAVLMFLFTVYIACIVFKFFDSYPCPCGGLFRQMGWKKHFRVNLLLTLIAVAGIFLMKL